MDIKKIWLYILLLMTIVAVPLASCDKDDEPKSGEDEQYDTTSDVDASRFEYRYIHINIIPPYVE